MTHFFSAVSLESCAVKILEKLAQKIILCSSNKGLLGTSSINQRIFNQKKLQTLSQNLPYLDIPVMATVNQPQLLRVNGEMGFVRIKKSVLAHCFDLLYAIDNASGAYFFDFTIKKEIFIPRVRLQALAPAWAISIHKAQGSEFDEVFILLSESSRYSGKALLYTALTRAKKKALLAADLDLIQALISEDYAGGVGLSDLLFSPE